MFSRTMQVSGVSVLLAIMGGAGCNTSSDAPASGPLPSINPTSCTQSTLDSCDSSGGGDSYGLSGRTLNGTTLEGDDLSGHGLLGVSLNGANGQNGPRGKVVLNGSKLSVKGGLIVGTTLEGQLDTGKSLSLRVDSETLGTGPDESDVEYYAVSYQTKSGFLPLCGVDTTGAPIAAIALAGRWNYSAGTSQGGSHIDDASSFTWACDGYALAKCAELGYKPWDTISQCDGRGCQDVSLAPTHQACTRAIRADYCGDGLSYTVDGTLIDMYDSFGLRVSAPTWPFEAEWTESGARCAVRLRNASLGTPSCWKSLHSDSCGSTADFSRGALVMTDDSPTDP